MFVDEFSLKNISTTISIFLVSATEQKTERIIEIFSSSENIRKFAPTSVLCCLAMSLRDCPLKVSHLVESLNLLQFVSKFQY